MDDPKYDDISGIVTKCLDGDRSAWSGFIGIYSGLIEISIKNCLSRYGLRYSREEIDDIRQDILCSIWDDKKLSTLKNIESLPYWLSIVSANEALRYRRAGKADEKNLLKIDDADKYDQIFDGIPSSGPRQDSELDNYEVFKKINESIKSLPPKERLIIKLHLLYDKKHDDISSILGIPKGTVSSYINRSKARLKKKLRHYKRFLQYFSLFLHLYI